ncbi:MAG: hypothetical protein V1728_06665 [Candidatus Micrarchaeota archaeon]
MADSKRKPARTGSHALLLLFAVILVLLSVYLIFFAAPARAKDSGRNEVLSPEFTDPAAKIALLSNENFTNALFSEAVAMEPLLNESGTRVHMGFWSGPNNHGNLVRLLDNINNAPSQNGTAQRAIWDEGTQSSLQYPSYVRMNAREHWYERAAQTNGIVTIYGVNYTDPYPLTFPQADQIWGEYSQRYADMAYLIRNATGKPVQVWCYVQGAKANRIFYSYELPELVKLQDQGVVVLHFAKTQDADWENPDEWQTVVPSAS